MSSDLNTGNLEVIIGPGGGIGVRGGDTPIQLVSQLGLLNYRDES